ncbi:AMP-binding protein [Croceicoccus sp. YJ47]|uniref:AMP-binding protein n=1 Tax=Croceicoccus sp. YJ47 TaxID=2798724 RepID=UPI001F29ADA8|nr:AMP-binding protein [Croceicoccus sp. YJ47]
MSEWPPQDAGETALVENYRHPGSWDQQFEPLTVPAMFAASRDRAGGDALVDFYGRRFTYREMHREASRIAAALQARGIGKGDRVGLFLPNVPMYVSAYYGIMIAGASAVNFSPLYTVEELAAQVADSGIDTLFTLDSSALFPTACKVLDQSRLERLIVGRLKHMLPIGKSALLRAFGRKQVSDLPDDDRIVDLWAFMAGHTDPEPVELDPMDDVALIQYTGGTTGVPKGAMLTHQNLTANARQVARIDAHRGERDVIVGVLPLFHVFANTCVLNRTVLSGGMIAMLPRFDARDTLKTIERVEATSLPGVPTMYQALIDRPEAAHTDFSSLRVCIAGGAPLPLPLKEKFQHTTGAKLIEGYGLTESSGVVSANPYEDGEKVGTIGQLLPGTRIRLLNKEDPSQMAAAGEPGELAIKGPQIMKGYWGRESGDDFADGYFRTGDVATVDAEGFLNIVDRIKDMISVGGFKVFPSQIEDILLEFDAVKEALVIGVPDAYRGESPKAFVTLNDGFAEDGDVLKDRLNARLGKHERVVGVVVREELPKTMIGKLDRKALRALEAVPA